MPHLRLPNGEPAKNMDKVMLLAIWEKWIKSDWEKHGRHDLEMISAGMGKPTLAINDRATSEALAAWGSIHNKASSAHLYLRDNGNTPETRDEIARMGKNGAVIGYAHPQGTPEARTLMAEALTKWYFNKVTFTPDDILFTAGGAGAIHTVLKVINDETPGGWILTPVPHYTLHKTSDDRTKIHPIAVMEEPGYRLTRKALEKSIALAHKWRRNISAFLFCDPNNPLGTMISEDEWQDIAECLRDYPDTPIILDEAYAEMRLDGKPYISLIEVAPDLHSRIILMRSATKALSAAGERMAIIETPSKTLMSKFLAENIRTTGHAPSINQQVFAKVLSTYGKSSREEIAHFYAPQIAQMRERLATIGAAMPDADYRVEGTFYILANLEDIKGMDIPKAAEAALGKSGKIETDEDIVYYLLFQGLMLAPLSYFGTDPQKGYVRITCSGGDTEIQKIGDILERCLTEARKIKKDILQSQLTGTATTKGIRCLLDKKEAEELDRKYPQLRCTPTHSPITNSLDEFITKGQLSRKSFNPNHGACPTNNSISAMSQAMQLKQYITNQEKYLFDAQAILNEKQAATTRQIRWNALQQYNQSRINIIRKPLTSDTPISTIQHRFRTHHQQKLLKDSLQSVHSIFKHWVTHESFIPPEAAEAVTKLTAHQRRNYKPYHDYLHSLAQTQQADEKEEEKIAEVRGISPILWKKTK